MSKGRPDEDAELWNMNATLRHIQNRSKLILSRKDKEENNYYLAW